MSSRVDDADCEDDLSFVDEDWDDPYESLRSSVEHDAAPNRKADDDNSPHEEAYDEDEDEPEWASESRPAAKQVEPRAANQAGIFINGRHFDRVNPIECVDEKFYSILMSDLAQVEPSRVLDYYGTHYDHEYAGPVETARSMAPSSYERGAQLGYTVGRFIGEKAAYQWPDPAELNYNLRLASLGLDQSEADSRQLERLLVAETCKRVAFSEANRQAFAKTLHSAYLNGVAIVPLWGVIHAQRVVAKRAAAEGAKVGSQAALKAAAELAPKASAFFKLNEHERALSAPHGPKRHLSDRLAGSSELKTNVSQVALDCGHRSGALMGAVLGLMVTPEAFEAYKRFRGSLHTIGSEFNQFKLGAMRGYELGETWAHLNYIARTNQNSKAVRTGTGSPSQERLNSVSQLEVGASKQAAESNLFQFMVINYGTHLVANHSRRHMLKMRTSAMDKELLQDMRAQAGDSMADPSKVAATSGYEDDEEGDDDMAEEDSFAGQRDSVENVALPNEELNIIDSDSIMDMSDELDGEA